MEIGNGSRWPAQKPCATARAFRVALGDAVKRFGSDARGDIAILFGLMSLVLFMMIGLAVDYGRFVNARSQTIAATDAAVLAGARALQTNGGNQAAALKVAQAYYSQATKNRLSLTNDTINFAIADNATAMVATGNAAITTPFMGLAGTQSLPILRADGSDYSKAVLAVGGNAELNLEISLMLDVSGSMGEGTKLQDMKDAANDLVDIVVWKDQSKFSSRVALVPFSTDVLPTADLFLAATGQSNTSVPSPASYDVTTGSGKNKKTTTYTYYPTACVGERAGQDYTDTAPGANHYVLREFASRPSRSNLPSGMGACGINSNGEMVPMTNDKTVLHNKIDSLVDGGNTGGHVGTAWTYYLLSPKWAGVLPNGSKPVAYGTEDTKKIAVLMTDGEYNSVHDNKGVETSKNGAGSSVNGTDSSSQAKSVCSDMKKNGIEIYTVGFDLGDNNTAITTLSKCATDAAHFYNSTTGDALKAAFRDIALKISTLYLSQ
jgi:Flp pilus assembly protein TadG